MKKFTHLLIALITISVPALAQPKLYLNLNSHNEMVGENYDTDSTLFVTSTGFVHDIAQLVVLKNAKWNFQTNSKYVLAALKYQHADTSHSDILEWMNSTGHICIDPRYKTQLPFYTYNIADVVHLLDSAGVPDSKTVGGFIYYPYTSADWAIYTSPVIGTHYGNSWQAEILWGAGSTPPHSHDAHNFGIWKPTGATDSVAFFSHSASGDLWVEGNGCSAVLTDTTDPIAVFNVVKEAANNIASGAWPGDKFYCMSMMINQRDFSSSFVNKVSQLIDSVNTLVSENKVVWASIQEKMDTFQTWSTATMNAYSQWSCESPTLGIPAFRVKNSTVYPNPFSTELKISAEKGSYYRISQIDGRVVSSGYGDENTEIDTRLLSPGTYILSITNEFRREKIIVNKID
ncbi:MAG: T9SS type A sorting domain-containing protein [Taibaiella sp.]|nr:T9SS type A sorting domain-containing protein [Taibaiella sp.]